MKDGPTRRTQVEMVVPATANETQGTAVADIVLRQDALARVEQVENHLSTAVQDLNHAAETNQTLRHRMEQCSDQVQHLQDRFRDLSDAESDRDIGRQLENAQPRQKENEVEQTIRDEVSRSFARIRSVNLAHVMSHSTSFGVLFTDIICVTLSFYTESKRN